MVIIKNLRELKLGRTCCATHLLQTIFHLLDTDWMVMLLAILITVQGKFIVEITTNI